MSRVVAALARFAAETPRAAAIEEASAVIDYATLAQEVAALAGELRGREARCVGLLAENGASWAIADLAALVAGIPLVPIPTFFSAAQQAYLAREAGIDLLLSDRPEAASGWGIPLQSLASNGRLAMLRLATDPVSLPAGTAKITFTSGSTGAPKGVCLSQVSIEAVAVSLAEASGASAGDRHLALLPLATLLENIGGLYVPLLAGACTCLLPGAQVGLSGSSNLDPAVLLGALATRRATSAILVPQLLQALLFALERRPLSLALRYVAVGGAPVSPRLLAAAERLGLPVFEGYGLSECASVVAVNRPGAQKVGSVGRPLSHLQVSIGEDGEIRVAGSSSLGYLGEAPRSGDRVETGDLGYFDAEGYLHLLGRRKHIFVTAFGRNVSPEWVERELVMQPCIAQAALFGEGRPFNVAVVVPRGDEDDRHIDAAIDATNALLPDYARIGRWIRAEAPFCVANGQLTANGRLRRDAIAQAFAEALARLYSNANPKEEHGLFC